MARLAVTSLLLLYGLLLANAALAQSDVTPLDIGYLEIAGDPRYEEQRGYTGIRLRTRHRPFDGAAGALRESRYLGRALKIEFGLERAGGKSAAELAAAIRGLKADKGVRFFIIDAAAEVLSEVAAATRGEDVLLFNVSEPANALRTTACHPNLMHVIPSRAMLMDGLAQYLVWKRWRRVLVLRGPLPEDMSLAAAFEASARKMGARVVAVKDFVLSNDPRERGQNNVALLTSAPDHDIVFLADSDGEFGRYVPFQTSKARPVVGTAGLLSDAWHWTWERHGAPQLNQRFEKRAGRAMTSGDWAAWAAVKALVESAQRTKSADFATISAYLKSDSLNLDAYKGTRASFRAHNNQLRQPILLHTHDAVVEQAPLPGFLHPTNDLDTLGFDISETRCGF